MLSFQKAQRFFCLVLTVAVCAIASLALPMRLLGDDLSEAQLTQSAQTFFDAYGRAIRKAADVSAFLDLLTDQVELTYAGKPGQVIPFAGTFIGHPGVESALKFLRRSSSTDSFAVEEILPTSFAVDFSKGFTPDKFLIPQHNRVSSILEERRTVLDTKRHYRLDVICLLTVEGNGKISNIHFFYDSYVPSEAYIGDHDQIVNPDIDPILNPTRDRSADPTATLFSVLNFFFTFANPDVSVNGNFEPLRAVITPDCVVSFAGDPKYLPFADKVIRQGADEVLRTFAQQLQNSRPRNFNIQEFFVAHDRVITNTLEDRTSTASNRGYEVNVEILTTVKEGRVGSIQGIFDSTITTTAFTGVDPFLSILKHKSNSAQHSDKDQDD